METIENVNKEKKTLDEKFEKFANIVEIIAALIIGISTIFGAFCAYQSSLYDGTSNEKYNRAVALINESSSEFVYNNQIVMEDVMYWLHWSEYKTLAQDPNDPMSKRYEVLADQLETVIPFELIQAIDWAEKENEKNPYKEKVVFYNYKNYIDNLNTYANKLQKKGNDIFESGQMDNNMGDKQTLNTVVFAIVLFLGSMLATSKRNLIKVIFFASMVLMFIYSTYQMLQVPALW